MAETPDKETEEDKQPEAARQGASSRVPAMLVSLSALAIIGAATANSLPNFNLPSMPNFDRFYLPNFSLPNFNRFAAQPPHETASAPIPDPAVSATLKDIQLSQQQNADLKRISRQLSLVTAQLNSVQNATPPLTTSSIPQPSIRARVVGTSRKIIPPLPKPVGPVSIGGAPLSPAPAPRSGAG